MNSMLKTTACLWTVFLLSAPKINAQFDVPRFQVGISGGAFIYQGDLTPEDAGSYRTMKPAVNIFAARLFSSSFAMRANLAFGALHGDDAAYSKPEYRRQRNYTFHSPVAEVSVKAEWSVLAKNYASRGFAPYVFAGAGVGFLNVKRDWSRVNMDYFGGAESELATGLAADAAKTPPRALPVFPVGLGLRYYLSDKIGISAETSYRFTASDYIDGFSYGANPSRNDQYHSHTIGVVYRLGKKDRLGCPVVNY